MPPQANLASLEPNCCASPPRVAASLLSNVTGPSKDIENFSDERFLQKSEKIGLCHFTGWDKTGISRTMERIPESFCAGRFQKSLSEGLRLPN